MTGTSSFRIRIWADVACPWCWIGHRRLSRALAARSDLQVALLWEPFQLQPDLPPEGIEWSRMVEERFDGMERARFLFEHVAELGAREGLDLRFDRMTRAPNTARAHALILAAREVGMEWELVDRLFAAHFQEGADLSDTAVLHGLAREAGLPRSHESEAVEGDRLLRAVAESQDAALALGVQGVPFFLIDGDLSLAGAQPVEVFTRALDAVRATDPGAAGRPAGPASASARRPASRPDDPGV